MGVLVPPSIIALFEIVVYLKVSPTIEFQNYQRNLLVKADSKVYSSETIVDSENENNFGKRMISIGIRATGLIIFGLGLLAENGRTYAV